MKFLTINGKLRKDSSGKFITVPDTLPTNKIFSLGGHVLKADGKIVSTEKTETPGLYDEAGNLVKTWDQLVSEGLVTVE